MCVCVCYGIADVRKLKTAISSLELDMLVTEESMAGTWKGNLSGDILSRIYAHLSLLFCALWSTTALSSVNRCGALLAISICITSLKLHWAVSWCETIEKDRQGSFSLLTAVIVKETFRLVSHTPRHWRLDIYCWHTFVWSHIQQNPLPT